MTETQRHPLKNKSSLTIHVNGNHQYWTDDDPVKCPSVTGLVAFTDSDGFGAGAGWASKLAAETGNPYEARAQTKLATDMGSEVHANIDNFIRYGTISEDPIFMAWYNSVGAGREWVASETLVYHPELHYGGTVDAFSLEGADG